MAPHQSVPVRAPLLLTTAAFLSLQACRNSTAPTSVLPPSFDVRCTSTNLMLDTTLNGMLNSASACYTRDLLNGESTFTRFYGLNLDAGRGYVVSMQGAAGMKSLLELTTSATSAETLLAASRGGSEPAQLLFASPATVPATIRVTTADGSRADTGSFTVVIRSCKVPVAAVTDSITHSDVTTAADCQLNLAALAIGDNNPSNVHLFLVHSTSDTLLRLVSFTASSRVRVFFGGPHEDTFGVTGGTMMGYLDTATVATSFYFAPGKAGDYTLAIGGDQGFPVSVSYTLTIGRERAFPATPAPVGQH